MNINLVNGTSQKVVFNNASIKKHLKGPTSIVFCKDRDGNDIFSIAYCEEQDEVDVTNHINDSSFVFFGSDYKNENQLLDEAVSDFMAVIQGKYS